MFECGKLKNIKISRKYINDFILLAAIFIVAIIVILINRITTKEGCFVNIDCYDNHYELSLDSEGFYVLSIEERNDSFNIELSDAYSNYELIDLSDYEFYNVIYIHDNTASVYDANCPDLVCVNSKALTYSGRSIICLPHKLSLEVVNNISDNGEPDAITF